MQTREKKTAQLTLVRSCIIQVEKYWNQDIQHIAALQHVKQKFLQRERFLVRTTNVSQKTSQGQKS